MRIWAICLFFAAAWVFTLLSFSCGVHYARALEPFVYVIWTDCGAHDFIELFKGE